MHGAEKAPGDRHTRTGSPALASFLSILHRAIAECRGLDGLQAEGSGDHVARVLAVPLCLGCWNHPV